MAKIDIQVLGAQRIYVSQPGNNGGGIMAAKVSSAPNAADPFEGAMVTSEWAAWVPLGTTEDGVRVQYANKLEDVYCDEMGGLGGVPCEILFKGALAYIRFVLVRYVRENAQNILMGLRNRGVDTVPMPGVRMFSDNLGVSIGMCSRNPSTGMWTYRVFSKCVFHEPREINIGTKAAKISVGAMAVTHYNNNDAGFFYASDLKDTGSLKRGGYLGSGG